MEVYIGGSITKDERPLLREKISKIIQNSLHRDISLLNSDITETMDKATKILKKINLINKRKNIDLDKYKTTTYPAFLWQEEYIAGFYLFAATIGYIDKKINNEKRKINFNSNFINSYNNSILREINESKKLIQNYLVDREKILEEFKTVLKVDGFNDMVLETLETQPSYKKFEELYKLDEESGMQLYIYQHLVSAYNTGYISENYDYEDIINHYNLLFNQLSIDKQKKEIQTQKAKCKKSNRR